jgi:UDP-N-acetylglucosamine acyltransferase
VNVHPSAVIGARVVVGEGASIGPFAVIGDDVDIGARCVLETHAVLRSGTVLGSDTTVDSFAVIGGDPQDLDFDRSTASGVVVGRGVTIREGVTIHRSTRPKGATRIGDRVYMMANSHVAHDCVVDEKVTIANNVMLAGHVHVGAQTVIGGGAGIHQFVRVGRGVMIGGNASVSRDVPPFTMVADRNRLTGLNKIGLRRHGFSVTEIECLKRCYRAVYGGAGDPQAKASVLAAGGEWDESELGTWFLGFFTEGRRGFARMRRAGQSDRGDG